MLLRGDAFALAARRKTSDGLVQAQQAPSDCRGGHGTVPYEQNTQQSPGLGRRTAPQPVQS
jgi:hypothetical protein